MKITINLDPVEWAADPARAKADIENAFYRLGQAVFETIGEHGKLIHNNGHHLAQEASAKAGQLWMDNLAARTDGGPR